MNTFIFLSQINNFSLLITGSASPRQLRITGIGQAEAGAGEAARGTGDGGEDKRVRLLGVFRQVEGGRPRGVRDGDTGRATG